MHISNGLKGPQFLNIMKWNQNLLWTIQNIERCYYAYCIMGSRHATATNESDEKAWHVYVTDMDTHTHLVCER